MEGRLGSLFLEITLMHMGPRKEPGGRTDSASTQIVSGFQDKGMKNRQRRNIRRGGAVRALAVPISGARERPKQKTTRADESRSNSRTKVRQRRTGQVALELSGLGRQAALKFAGAGLHRLGCRWETSPSLSIPMHWHSMHHAVRPSIVGHPPAP